MEDGREQKHGSNISMFQTTKCKKMLHVQFGGHVSKGQNVSSSFLSDRIMTYQIEFVRLSWSIGWKSPKTGQAIK